MPLLARMIGSVLGMDLINVEVTPNEVVYVYRTDGIIDSERIEKMKATLMSILSLPADIPSRIEVQKAKKGIIMKGFIVKVTVPKRGVNLRGLFRRKGK